jgi:hypothetical protein
MRERLAGKATCEDVSADHVVKEVGRENVFEEDEGAEPGWKVCSVLFDGSRAVVEGNFNVDSNGLEGKGEAAYTTQGIDSSELRWQRWRGPDGCPLVVVVNVEKGESGMFVYLDCAYWQFTRVEVVGSSWRGNERGVCDVEGNCDGGAK